MKPAIHNIARLYVIKASKWFMLVMPIVVLFYQENGLGMREVFILQAFYSIAIVVLEIPSGYFADVLGRKNTLIIGCFLGFLGYLTYSFSYGFWGFLLAEIILGFGQSLISGADSALLYDTLIQSNDEKSYVKHEGRMVSAGNFAEALAGIAGGLLAAYSLRYPYYFQTLISLVSVPAALTLFEPRVTETKIGLSLKAVLGVVRHAFIENIQLRWNIIFSSVVGASTLLMAWFVQPWFISIEMPVSLFGVFWTVLNLSVGITAMVAYKVELKFGPRTTVLWFTIVLALGFLGIAYFDSYWGFIFLFPFYLARGLATPILKVYINRITPSNVRATILSVRNFTIRIIFALWGPFYGWYTDKFSLAGAMYIAAIVFIVLTGVCYYFFVSTNFSRSKEKKTIKETLDGFSI